MSDFQTPQKQIVRRSSLVCPSAPSRPVRVVVDAQAAPMRPLNLGHTALVMQEEADAFIAVAVPRTPERVRRQPVCPGAPTNKARVERSQSSPQ